MKYFRHDTNQINTQTANKCTVSLQPLCTTPLCSTPVLYVAALSNYRTLLCHNMMFNQFKMSPNNGCYSDGTTVWMTEESSFSFGLEEEDSS